MTFLGYNMRDQDMRQNGCSDGLAMADQDDNEDDNYHLNGEVGDMAREQRHQRKKGSPKNGDIPAKKSLGVRFTDSLIRKSVSGYRSLRESGRQLLGSNVDRTDLDVESPTQVEVEELQNAELPDNRASINVTSSTFGGFFPRRTRRQPIPLPTFWIGSGARPADVTQAPRSSRYALGYKHASINAFSSAAESYSTASPESETLSERGAPLTSPSEQNTSLEISLVSHERAPLDGMSNTATEGECVPINSPVYESQKMSSSNEVREIKELESLLEAKAYRISNENAKKALKEQSTASKAGKSPVKMFNSCTRKASTTPKSSSSASKLCASKPKRDEIEFNSSTREITLPRIIPKLERRPSYNRDKRNSTEISGVHSKLIIISSIVGTVGPNKSKSKL